MKKFLIPFAAASLVLTAAPAAAQAEFEIEDSDQLEALRACKDIAEDAARLACYDSAAGKLTAAIESGEVQVVDKEDVKEARRGLFGFSLPKIKLFGSDGDDGEQLEMLESTITSVSRTRGGYIFQIKDGDATWEIKKAPMRLRTPKAGDTVVFKKASFNTYFIRIEGQIGVKGTRIR